MVMGRTTWQDSQLGHPVPDRLSYVVTRNADNCPEADGVIQGDIVQRILDLQHVYQDKTIWIIGGATLIEATLSIIDEFVLSRIQGTYGCDDFTTDGFKSVARGVGRAASRSHISATDQSTSKMITRRYRLYRYLNPVHNRDRFLHLRSVARRV